MPKLSNSDKKKNKAGNNKNNSKNVDSKGSDNYVCKSEFMQIMQERGFLHQATDIKAIDEAFASGRVTAYVGFDATAESLHVGSLMQIMLLRWLQKTGHKPIILIGGGTTKIGDPSGKDEARKLLSNSDIEKNIASISTIFEQFLKIGTGAQDAIIVNNAEWLDNLNYIEFLQKYGRYFSVNRMLSQDSVKLRLEREQNLSFLEFNYMILQAYDFLELSKRYGCVMQIGGSDQWGNIVMGIDLARKIDAEGGVLPISPRDMKGARLVEIHPIIQSKRSENSSYESSLDSFKNYISAENESAKLLGLTTPLIETSSGAKMGKTASGAVWLNKNILTPYAYWQYWRNVDDADIGRFLKLFTELPLAEISKLENLQGAEINEAKKILANEATKLCHGSHAARQAAETAKQTFENGGVGADIPLFQITKSELGKGVAAYELLRLAGLAESGGEARRLIRGGGARLNENKISDENELISQPYFDKNNELKLSAGRKKHVLVRLSEG